MVYLGIVFLSHNRGTHRRLRIGGIGFYLWRGRVELFHFGYIGKSFSYLGFDTFVRGWGGDS